MCKNKTKQNKKHSEQPLMLSLASNVNNGSMTHVLVNCKCWTVRHGTLFKKQKNKKQRQNIGILDFYEVIKHIKAGYSFDHVVRFPGAFMIFLLGPKGGGGECKFEQILMKNAHKNLNVNSAAICFKIHMFEDYC